MEPTETIPVTLEDVLPPNKPFGRASLRQVPCVWGNGTMERLGCPHTGWAPTIFSQGVWGLQSPDGFLGAPFSGGT